jgi:hypothetical protein
MFKVKYTFPQALQFQDNYIRWIFMFCYRTTKAIKILLLCHPAYFAVFIKGAQKLALLKLKRQA